MCLDSKDVKFCGIQHSVGFVAVASSFFVHTIVSLILN